MDKDKLIKAIETSTTMREAAKKVGFTTQWIDVKLKSWNLEVVRDTKLRVITVNKLKERSK